MVVAFVVRIIICRVDEVDADDEDEDVVDEAEDVLDVDEADDTDELPFDVLVADVVVLIRRPQK